MRLKYCFKLKTFSYSMVKLIQNWIIIGWNIFFFQIDHISTTSMHFISDKFHCKTSLKLSGMSKYSKEALINLFICLSLIYLVLYLTIFILHAKRQFHSKTFLILSSMSKYSKEALIYSFIFLSLIYLVLYLRVFIFHFACKYNLPWFSWQLVLCEIFGLTL